MVRNFAKQGNDKMRRAGQTGILGEIHSAVYFAKENMFVCSHQPAAVSAFAGALRDKLIL